MKRLYAPISKVEESDDGTMKVWGYASTGGEDDEGETIQPEAMKAALPDYLKWGAVREMHQPKAVGTAIEANVQDDGRTWFGAHVVDPIAVKKIQTKVLKGFSVGGRVTERDDLDKSIITGINLIEISLVDRPANPECEFIVAKRSKEADIDDLAELLKGGTVDTTALLDAADAIAKGDDKPYGDVNYADPGYQSDKKKRYPIDTAAHIRAAWSYINKEKNQAQYSSSQVSQIKARIVAAWKKKIDKDGPPSAEKLAKGMYNVSAFAQCLESLAWVCMSAQSDFDWEGDASPVPEKMRSWMQQGADIFCEMAEEESRELVESLQSQAGEAIENVMKGADAMKLNLADLEKGKMSKEMAANLSAHAEHLGKLHKAVKECAAMCKEACEKADAMKPQDDDPNDEAGKAAKAAAAAALAAAPAAPAAAAPATPPEESPAVELAKVIGAAIESAVGDLKKDYIELRKQFDIMSRQPAGGAPVASQAAADALLAAKGLTAVSRDGAGGDAAALPIAPVMVGGRVDESATVIKAMLDPKRARYMENAAPTE